MNNHNNVFWGDAPPEEVTDKQLKGPKVTAFVAYNARRGLLGPYWFEERGRTVTITANRYCEIIRQFHADLNRILTPGQFRLAWFMQDGTSPHTAHETISYLQELFGNRLLCLGTRYEWSPHSPDLNPLDFWLWGAAKGSIYANKPDTLAQLKRNVRNYIQQVPIDILTKVGQNFGMRIKACFNRGGDHIESVNYKKFAV